MAIFRQSCCGNLATPSRAWSLVRRGTRALLRDPQAQKTTTMNRCCFIFLTCLAAAHGYAPMPRAPRTGPAAAGQPPPGRQPAGTGARDGGGGDRAARGVPRLDVRLELRHVLPAGHPRPRGRQPAARAVVRVRGLGRMGELVFTTGWSGTPSRSPTRRTAGSCSCSRTPSSATTASPRTATTSTGCPSTLSRTACRCRR